MSLLKPIGRVGSERRRARLWLVPLLAVMIDGQGVRAAEPIFEAPSPAPLFAATSTVDIEVETDLRALRNSKREPGFQPAVLRWQADGRSGELAIGVSPRGRFRLDRENCRFPPLFFQFPEGAGGLFAAQGIVPVTTHCVKSNAQYVVGEYLLYRAYALLTESSVAVRLARTRYVDSSGRGSPLETLSFLMEHFEAVGRRIGASLVDDPQLRPGMSEPHATALVDVFQYMIGNTDWSMLAQHNIALLRTANGDIVPLPYDFDFAGVIGARYAVPSEKLSIRSVKERQYRGFCQPDAVVEQAIARIRGQRQAIFDLYHQEPELDPPTLRRSLRYLNGFFEIAASPETRRRRILEACRRAFQPPP